MNTDDVKRALFLSVSEEVVKRFIPIDKFYSEQSWWTQYSSINIHYSFQARVEAVQNAMKECYIYNKCIDFNKWIDECNLLSKQLDGYCSPNLLTSE